MAVSGKDLLNTKFDPVVASAVLGLPVQLTVRMVIEVSTPLCDVNGRHLQPKQHVRSTLFVNPI